MIDVPEQNRAIYKSLEIMADDLTNLPENRKSKADGFMDLCMDRLGEEHGKTVIALAHYFEQNGDLVCDPDMEIAIYTQEGRAEALTYQDQRHYCRVYDEDGTKDKALADDLNGFLELWLSNLIAQGHSIRL